MKIQFVPHRERRVAITATNGLMLCREIIAVHCENHIRRGADKSLAFSISYFPICSTTKRIFLGWVKEVRTTKT
jgi:hypothetical protein